MPKYEGPHGTSEWSFPNIVPLIEATLELGFEIVSDSYNSTVLMQMMGGIPFYVRISHDTACWDRSDETELGFAVAEQPTMGSNVHSTKYLGTHKVLTALEIKQLIRDYIVTNRHASKAALSKEYANFEKWNALAEWGVT